MKNLKSKWIVSILLGNFFLISAYASECDLYVTYGAAVTQSTRDNVEANFADLGYQIMEGKAPEKTEAFESYLDVSKSDAYIEHRRHADGPHFPAGTWLRWDKASLSGLISVQNPLNDNDSFQNPSACQAIDLYGGDLVLWKKESTLKRINLESANHALANSLRDDELPTCAQARKIRADFLNQIALNCVPVGK
jgi:hypothetical protein